MRDDDEDGLDDLEHREPGPGDVEAVDAGRADVLPLSRLAAAFPPLADGDPCGRRAVASWCRRHGLPVERSRAHGRPLAVSLRELRLVHPAAHAAVLAGERGHTLEELRPMLPPHANGEQPSGAALLRWLRSVGVPVDRLGTGHLVWPADVAGAIPGFQRSLDLERRLCEGG